jgi:hypothetical protein
MEFKGTQGKWLVFNIGCIECGVPSNVVGTYESEDEAKKIAKICEEKLDWRHGGQNSFEVFNLEAEQDEEYSEVIRKATE